MYPDKINAAVVECLEYACDSPFPPVPAAAYLRRLRADLQWNSDDVDTVESAVTRIIHTFMERQIGAGPPELS